jgi:predicted NAD/FAD-dependent oxidoreductase
MRVGIVGAGISGLAAGLTLAHAGADVALFEKARGVGGRTTVRRSGDFAFDHGAQYFTARDPRFARAVADWRTAGAAAEWSGQIMVLGDGPIRPSDSVARYVGVPAMNAPAKLMAQGLAVQTGIRVARLQPSRDPLPAWTLTSDADEPLGTFDAIVLALPSAQAADLLPPGPRADATRACPMTPCWAAMVGFNLPIDTPLDGAFVHNSPLTWIARNNSKPGRPHAESWVLHASPAWTTQHYDDAPAAVAQQLLSALSQAIGVRLPEHAFLDTHRWRYAHAPAPLDASAVSCQERIALCGDWSNGGRVEGAYLSGIAAAERILAT